MQEVKIDVQEVEIVCNALVVCFLAILEIIPRGVKRLLGKGFKRCAGSQNSGAGSQNSLYCSGGIHSSRLIKSQMCRMFKIALRSCTWL